jgi:hypothetical protein
MQEFINHWQTVNVTVGGLPPAPILLQGGYSAEDLTADRTTLLNLMNEQPGLDNERSIAAATRDQAKAALQERFFQLEGAIKGVLFDRPVLQSIPKAPKFGAVESRFLQPFIDMKNLWTRINALAPSPDFTPPLTLGTYTIANFTADIAALEEVYQELSVATGNARQNRYDRDALLKPAKARLQQYKNAVIGRLGRLHPLVATIPVLSPPPGSTPDPVNLSAVWVTATNKARLVWTPSADEHLDHYEVRSSPGTKYDTSDEFLVANVTKTELELLTDSGLIAPGSAALFKVYVVLDTHNEKGSNSVKVTHPAA